MNMLSVLTTNLENAQGGNKMKNETARDIMRSAEISLDKEMTLDKVSDHLTKHHLPGAPVVDANKKPIGYVSEFDCLKQLMQSSYYCDNTSLVKDVMTTELIVSRPDIAIIDLASLMNTSKVNVMPIVESGKLLGMVSRGDVMRALVREMAECKIPV